MASLGSGREIANQTQALNNLASSAQILISLNISNQATLSSILGTQMNLIRDAQTAAVRARHGTTNGNGNRNTNGNGNGDANGNGN